MAAHLEALGGEADGGLALEPSIPHGHLKVVDGSVHGSGAVGLHDSDVMAVVVDAEVLDGHLVDGHDCKEARAVGGVELGWHGLRVQCRCGGNPLRRGPPPRRQAHRVHRRRCRRLRLLVRHHSPIKLLADKSSEQNSLDRQ